DTRKFCRAIGSCRRVETRQRHRQHSNRQERAEDGICLEPSIESVRIPQIEISHDDPSLQSRPVTTDKSVVPDKRELCDLAHRVREPRTAYSMPDHRLGRCDGHHEMIDFRLRIPLRAYSSGRVAITRAQFYLFAHVAAYPPGRVHRAVPPN